MAARGTKRWADENQAPSNRPQKRAGKSSELEELLAVAGASRCAKTADWRLEDAFSFRQRVAQQVLLPELKEKLVGALTQEWSEMEKLEALLRPTVGSDSSANDSLIRLLLHVEALQSEIAAGLMQLLPDYQDETTDSGGFSMIRRILSQFRWLERIIDGAALVEAASDIMQVADPTLKRELLLVLPDLVEDGQHAAAAQTLLGILREDTRFLACVLDAFGSLVLEEDVLAEVCETVMGAVGASSVEDLPVVIRFLLQHMTPANAKPMLRALRTGMPLELLTSLVDSSAEIRPTRSCQASGEALVVDALQTAMRLRKEVTVLVLRHLEAISNAEDHSPLDWWLVCAAYTTSGPFERKKVLRLVIDKASKRRFGAKMLRTAIHGHGVALSPHFASHLELASGLLQKPNLMARQTGGLLYALVFNEFSEVFKRQELLGHLMAHVGSGAATEIEAALCVLVNLATNDTSAVRQFSPFLTYILDYLSSLSVTQARLAFELFARLAYDGAAGGGSRLADELLITIRKQLSSSTPHYKCLGLLGGCCMLKRLGVHGADEIVNGSGPGSASQTGASQAAPLLSRRMMDAHGIFSMMCKHSANADGTFSFLLHELSHLVAGREPSDILSKPLLDLIIDRVTSTFESTYLVDTGEALASSSPVRGLYPKPYLDIDLAGNEGIALNIVPMLEHTDGAAALQRHALSTLSANFQLLRLCEAATSEDGESLDAVDAVLGAPLVLFEPRILGPALSTFAEADEDTRQAACLALFYAVDWLRELLNGFCAQRAPEMRAKVVMRTTQLVVLENVLDACLAGTPSFRLPGIISDQRATAPKSRGRPASNAKAKEAKVPKKAPASKGASKQAMASKRKGDKKTTTAAAGRGSDVDSSDDEAGAETAIANEHATPAVAGGGTARRSRPGRPAAPQSLLSHPYLAQVQPHLRGVSIRTSLILTYGAGHMRKEVDTRDETVAVDRVELSAGATHFLLRHMHEKVKAAAATGGTTRGRAPASNSGGNGQVLIVQDLSSMELRGLTGLSLLITLKPVLLNFRESLEALHEELRDFTTSRPLPEEPDMQQALIDILETGAIAESAAARAEYANSSFVLMLRILHTLLTWEQLHEAEAEAHMMDVLAHLGAHAALSDGSDCGGSSRASQLPDPVTPSAKAETCARAFDFFEALRADLESPRVLAHILDVQHAVLSMQRRIVPNASAQWSRFTKLAAGAEDILRRPDPTARDERLGGQAVKSILECQATHTERPRELIKACAEDWLPALDEDPRAEPPEEQPFLTLKTAPHYLKTMFGLLRSECAALGLPAPAARLEARSLEEHYQGFDSAYISAELHELIELFASLAQAMRGKYDSSPAVISTVIQMTALLKALQPTTRMLQALCVDVKTKLHTSSLAPATRLKRELENLLFKVKVMLQQNNCREAFWVGNLKHKNTIGVEVGSQMCVEVGPKRSSKRTGSRADDEIEENDEALETNARPLQSQPSAVVDIDQDSPIEDAEGDVDEDEDEGDEHSDGDGDEDGDGDGDGDEDEDDDDDEYPASMLGDEDDE